MNARIRSETPSDAEPIRRLIAGAFRDAAHTSRTEHLIVDALREAGQLCVSLVAEDDQGIVGHVAVSPVSVSDWSEGWYGLGPLAVASDHRMKGVGSRLVEQALAQRRASGAAGCVVVGEPGYYGRFGFKAERTLVLADVPPEYFQAIAFRAAVPVGTVSYHEAFNAQGEE